MFENQLTRNYVIERNFLSVFYLFKGVLLCFMYSLWTCIPCKMIKILHNMSGNAIQGTNIRFPSNI